ncbi:hypothetical protein GQ44DRAFT_690083 [Phaeosphaeriaceae sp. PMI808]|nr:hypothetical protein GQ44DRAFT_690083 [Phaeosphaeriaceae sp. PMI808]
MRFWTVLAFLAVFITSAHAQGALAALAQHMPKCSLACFVQEIPKSTCATNLTSQCLCANTALNTAIGACAKNTCTVYELLQTKNVSSKGCGAPVRYKGAKFVGIGIGGGVLAVATYVLRMAASIGKGGRELGWDDAAMGIVVLLAIPPTVFAPILEQNGLGRDIWTLKPEQITNVLKYYYFGEIFYVVALGISKISILFFYLRVFPSKGFRQVTYTIMAFSWAYTIAFFFATTFQCAPVRQAWTQWDKLHSGRCNNIHLQGWVAAAINISLDIAVMVLPLKHLANLQMSLRKKLMVMAMFSVGIFVIVVSTIRLETLIHFASTQNVTWDYVEAGYWSLIEIDVSIICGCMPALRFLILKTWPKVRSTFNASKGNSSNGTSTSDSKFSSGGEKSNAASGKLARLSLKPKSEDESDFIPLVNVDNKSAHMVSVRDAASDRTSTGWIRQTSSIEIRNAKAVSATEFPEPPHEWTAGRPITGKEHV